MRQCRSDGTDTRQRERTTSARRASCPACTALGHCHRGSRFFDSLCRDLASDRLRSNWDRLSRAPRGGRNARREKKVARFSDILPPVHRSHMADHEYPGASQVRAFSALKAPLDTLVEPPLGVLLQQMTMASPAALPAAACTCIPSIPLLTAPLCALPSQIALPRCTIGSRSTIAHGTANG